MESLKTDKTQHITVQYLRYIYDLKQLCLQLAFGTNWT